MTFNIPQEGLSHHLGRLKIGAVPMQKKIEILKFEEMNMTLKLAKKCLCLKKHYEEQKKSLVELLLSRAHKLPSQPINLGEDGDLEGHPLHQSHKLPIPR